MKTGTFRHFGVLAFAVLAGASQAILIPVSGATNLVTNPANMKYKADAYGVPVTQYWSERQNVTLANDLVVSMFAPAGFPTNVTNHFNDNDHKIAAGTTINSHYVYFDPASGSTVVRFKTDAPILGLITNERTTAANDHFMLSDYLIDPLVPAGNRSTTHFEARGLEIGSNEYVRWYANNDIEFHLSASSPADQIRVITAVPEPSTIGLAFGAVTLLLRRRRR